MSKKTIIMGIFVMFFFGKLWADNDAPPLTNPMPKVWQSENSQDTITIDNPSGQELVVEITLNDNQTVPGVTGANIYNCNNKDPTQHVDQGSTITCLTHDANNPIRIESDRAGQKSSGTFTIRTR
jgi:hypothetical protein